MEDRRRPKRVASLIKATLGRILVREFQGAGTGLITVTRVEMTADLQSARVFISLFGHLDPRETLNLLERKKGYLRRAIASEVKLKYNPTLDFALDPTPEYESRIDALINRLTDDPDRDS